MEKSQFKVRFLDVWGNLEEGFWVNDRSEIGMIELSEEAEKSEILQALYEKGILVNPETIDMNEIEILDAYPDWEIEFEGKPALQLTPEEEG